MSVVSQNAFLSETEMQTNAKYIWQYLGSRGWTRNAVAGMLGNMETESTINPGIWQNLDAGNTSLGFGLVQWTPATKLMNWAERYSLDYTSMDAQLRRITWELAEGEQYYATDAYPLSFAEFSKSTESPEYLAQAFLLNYERPADQTQPARSTQARKWFDYLANVDAGGGEGGSEGSEGGTDEPDEPTNPTPPTVRKHSMKLIYKYIATRKKVF